MRDRDKNRPRKGRKASVHEQSNTLVLLEMDTDKMTPPSNLAGMVSGAMRSYISFNSPDSFLESKEKCTVCLGSERLWLSSRKATLGQYSNHY